MEEMISGMMWGVLFGVIISQIIHIYTVGKTYFNSNVKYITNKRFFPEFEVVNIEAAEDGNHNMVAKYTIRNCFFAKKNNKNFQYQTFHFYDKIDMYKIGDIITFTKLCHNTTTT